MFGAHRNMIVERVKYQSADAKNLSGNDIER